MPMRSRKVARATVAAQPQIHTRVEPSVPSAPPGGTSRAAMTSRGPGWASRTPEMEEKEQLRRQIRLLQGEGAAARERVLSVFVTAVDPFQSGRCRWRSPDGRLGWEYEWPVRVRPVGDRPSRLRGD